MQSRPDLLVGGLCLLGVAAYAPVLIAQHLNEAAARQSASGALAKQDGFSSAEKDFIVGRSVYLRSSKTRIGRILAVEEHHSFPRSFPRRHTKAVLIERFDGPRGWQPVEGITRLYVVR